jgi:hypothetical protein
LFVCLFGLFDLLVCSVSLFFCLFVSFVCMFVCLLACLFVLLFFSRDSSKPVNTEDCTYNNVASRFFVM